MPDDRVTGDGTLDDVTTVIAFLVFYESEHQGAMWGGKRVDEAIEAFCRIAGMDPARARNALLGTRVQ